MRSRLGGVTDPLDVAKHFGRTGRALLGSSPFDNAAFKWVIISLSVLVGILLIALMVWGFFTKCGRSSSAPISPEAKAAPQGAGPHAAAKVTPGGDVEHRHAGGGTPAAHPQAAPGQQHPQQHPQPPGGHPTDPAQKAPGGMGVAAPPGTPPVQPVPPWQASPERLPPGIVLNPVVPPFYNPLLSNPRLPTDPPYERLVLVSSRVYQADQVARAVLPNVAYVVYDWKNFTLQELLRYVKKVLGAQKVTSLAVVAPGSKAGSVGLLEGATTSPDKLAAKSELTQFWRVLAGCVALSGTADGRRVDLLGCRVVEAPREGAALLKELWNLTTVPFAAADDALGGYMLATFMEEPTTKQLGLISSTIPAVDLYFNKHVLLGLQPPGGMPAMAHSAPPPLPPGPPPPGAVVPVGTAGPMAHPGAAAHGAPPPPLAPGAPGSPAPPQPQARAGQPPGFPPPAHAAPPPPGAPGAPGYAGAAGPTAVAAAAAAAPVYAAGVAAHSAAPPPAPAAPGGDIFSRLSMALAQRGKTADAAFTEFDKDRNGALSVQELTELMKAYVPDASAMDIKHFTAMLDTEKEDGVLSRSEFVVGLPDNVRIQEMVRSGRDEDEVVLRLQEYLTDNEAIIKDTFSDFDKDGSGHLDHKELQQLIACIPGLDPSEKKFILAYLYHYDSNRDQRVNYEELRIALKQFGTPPAAIARAVAGGPTPGTSAAAAAGAAAAAAVPGVMAHAAPPGAPPGGLAPVGQLPQAQALQAAAVQYGQAAAAQYAPGAAGQMGQVQALAEQAAAGQLPQALQAAAAQYGQQAAAQYAPGAAGQMGQVQALAGQAAAGQLPQALQAAAAQYGQQAAAQYAPGAAGQMGQVQALAGQAAAGQLPQALQAAAAQYGQQAAAQYAPGAAGQMGQVQALAGQAAAGQLPQALQAAAAQYGQQAAAQYAPGAANAALQSLAPLAPPGGLAPLAPLGRPGGLAPLAPLPGR